VEKHLHGENRATKVCNLHCGQTFDGVMGYVSKYTPSSSSAERQRIGEQNNGAELVISQVAALFSKAGYPIDCKVLDTGILWTFNGKGRKERRAAEAAGDVVDALDQIYRTLCHVARGPSKMLRQAGKER